MNDKPADQAAGGIDQSRNFEQQAEARSPGFFSELLAYLKHNRKWWLVPIILVLLLMGLLVAVGGSSLAPFIYALW
jgi:hypothetical protein